MLYAAMLLDPLHLPTYQSLASVASVHYASKFFLLDGKLMHKIPKAVTKSYTKGEVFLLIT